MEQQSYLTVTALTKYIKRKFDADPYLQDIAVKGEISNYKRHTSGHMYFTLKDKNARLLAVMFSASNRRLKFEPENGMNVLIRGNLSVYEAGGQYQIYVKDMQPDGIGALYLAYEQLKEKLEREGLFDPRRKRPVPAFPETIAVITSPTGAAIRDIITTIKRRYPIGRILVVPALVQGEKASASIADAIRRVNEDNRADVLIAGRGGGSIEELWAFNEENVARAMYESAIPVISAVGHETDYTIADFVADLRAPTPTAAAELAVPHMDELLERVLNRKTRLFRSMRELLSRKENLLAGLNRSYIFRNPGKLYEQRWQQLDRLTEKLQQEPAGLLKRSKEKHMFLHRQLAAKHPHEKIRAGAERQARADRRLQLEMAALMRSKQMDLHTLIGTLEALSPLKTLQRGFSAAYTEESRLLKSVKQAAPGDKINLLVADGELLCNIEEVKERNHDGGSNDI